MIIEVVCLTIFSIRLVHSKYCHDSSFTKWIKDLKNLASVGVIVLTVIDMIAYTITFELAGPDKAVRWSRILRPVLMVTFVEMKVVRLAFSNIRKTSFEILYVLILLFLVIAIFALLGREIFQHKGLFKVDGTTPYFTEFFEICWDLYVLVTTANSPDIMMPAYDKNSWFLIYFFFYIFVSLYMFMSIFLAIIYKNYRKHLKNEVQRTVYNKRRKLDSAWAILEERHGDRHLVSCDRWRKVVERAHPELSSRQVLLLWKALDRDGSNYIDKQTFMKTSDVICVPIVRTDIDTPLCDVHCSGCYNSRASVIIRRIVDHKFFSYAFDLLIVVNAFCIGFYVDEGEPAFLALFSLEIILKIYSRGVRRFFRKFWNIFDFVVISLAVVFSIAEATTKEFDSGVALDILLVLRVLRLVRLLNGIQRFYVIVETVINIGSSILTFGAVFLIVFYMFAIIGMEFYAGKVTYYGYEKNATNLTEEQRNCGNMALKNSDFVRGHYCNNNFNDITQAFIILVELMIVNQWHVIAEGYVLVTNKWSRLFFFCFHIVVVIVLVNIFIAFILEVFMVEYSLSKTEFETIMEKVLADLGLNRESGGSIDVNNRNNDTDDIDVAVEVEERSGDKGKNVNFTIRRGRVSMLTTLQNMFDGELEVDDIGPADIENVDDIPDSEVNPRPVSLSNIP